MSLRNNSMRNICRVCLEECKKLYPLLGILPNVDEDICTMIKYCTLVEVILADDLPSGVCIPCFKIIRIAYNFIKQFRETNRELLENKDNFGAENLQKQEYESCDENVEEIIIEYSKDWDSHKTLNTQDENVREVKIEGKTLSNQEPSKEEGSQEKACKNSVTLPEEKSDVEFKNITDNAEDEYLEKTEESNTISQNQILQKFTCPICRQSFKKFEVGFVKHFATHEDAKLNCDKCSLGSTLTMNLYIQHFREAHRFQCHICSKSYGRRSGLCYHIKTHRGTKTYKCSYKNCGKSFLTAWCLRKHLHTHSESAKFVCSKCGIEFKTYGSYKYHQKTHDGNRSYLCTSCGQTFLQLIHLKYHMWKHTGIKMFQCDMCHKSYTSQTQLKKHKRKNCEDVPKIEEVT